MHATNDLLVAELIIRTYIFVAQFRFSLIHLHRERLQSLSQRADLLSDITSGTHCLYLVTKVRLRSCINLRTFLGFRQCLLNPVVKIIKAPEKRPALNGLLHLADLVSAELQLNNEPFHC
jgi:hypothetical protein